MAPSRKDLYESLGIERGASSEDIRKAYRRKALQTHPDRLPQGASQQDINNAAEQFRSVNNAYEILSNNDNRELYDRHGVWPPPNVETQQPDPFDYFDAFGYRARHHNAHRPYTEYTSPFDEDPFFAGFNRSHNQFRFSDPFTLFDRMFKEMDRGFGRPSAGHNQHPFGGTGFPGFPGFPNNNSMFGPSAFDSFFGPSFGPSMGPFGNNNSFGDFGGSMHPRLGFSSFEQGTSGNGRNGIHSHRVEMMTQTINGVRHTIKKKVDNDGNVTEERTYPDGRKDTFFNGVLQSSEPAKIERNKKRKDHGTPRIEAPKDDNYPEAQTSEKKRKQWWHGF